jgi:hypothetical protein
MFWKELNRLRAKKVTKETSSFKAGIIRSLSDYEKVRPVKLPY